MSSVQPNEPGDRWNAFAVKDEQHVIATRRGGVGMPAIRRPGAQLIFARIVEHQLNHTLLSISVVRGRHRPDQHNSLNLTCLMRVNFELVTHVDYVGR